MQCRGFDPHLGLGVVSFSKTLHPHFFKVLVKPRKPSQNNYKKLLTWTLSLKQTKIFSMGALLNLIFYCGHFQIQCFTCLCMGLVKKCSIVFLTPRHMYSQAGPG